MTMVAVVDVLMTIDRGVRIMVPFYLRLGHD
jgi:hypothetical protein